MTPIVYAWEHQINALYKKERLEVDGSAYGWDGSSVFHVYTEIPPSSPGGTLTKAKFIFNNLLNLENLTESTILAYFKEDPLYQAVVILFLAVEKSILRKECFIVNSRREILRCDLKFIPEQSELYSRNKGLLETDVLSKKTVGIIGLGSGGSTIAVEMAKAGIGQFVLIDFDRLELSNLSRHICGINDLGRSKTFAVRDIILQKNPHAQVSTLEIDINQNRDACTNALAKVDLIVGATDNDQSRFFLNELCLKYKIPGIFGRAIIRAAGGDVLRVRPFQGPCYSCLYSQNVRQEGGDDEEISQKNQAKKLLPSYTSEQDVSVAIQVGLSSDISPISNFIVKLGLVELSKGLNSGISSLEEDLISDFYIWANRRDFSYKDWGKLEFGFTKPSILRWYGARVKRDPNCMVCGI